MCLRGLPATAGLTIDPSNFSFNLFFSFILGETTLKVARLLLEHGADNFARCDKFFLPLHFASYVGNAELVLLLLKYVKTKSDVRTISEEITPMHVAARAGHLNVVKALLDAEIDPNTPDINGFTPLHLASDMGHSRVVQHLLQAGASPKSRTKGLDLPIHLAAARGHTESIKMLVEADPSLASAPDKEKNTVLHYCCRTQNLDAVKVVLPIVGPSGLTAANMSRDTPLHWACYHGAAEVLIHVLSSKGSTGFSQIAMLENVFGETLLHAAATFGRSPLLLTTLLGRPGADVNVQGHDGHTPLHSACYHGHAAAALQLIEAGADLRIRTYDERETCAMWCHQQGYDDLLRVIQHMALQYAQRDVRIIPIETAASPSSNRNSSSHAKTTTGIRTPSGDIRGGSGSCESASDVEIDGVGNPIPKSNSGELDEKEWHQLVTEVTGLPMPSPLGRIRSITARKSEVSQLKNVLPKHLQVDLKDVTFVGVVASGSFGQVYRASYKGQVVAAKRYKSENFRVKSDVDMYCRECQMLSLLDHPNVLRFIGASVDEPSKFAILTEFVEGGSLYGILHVQHRTLDLPTNLNLAHGISKGMSYLHSLDPPIMHRDLNSHNILFGGVSTAVIADFGEGRFFKRYRGHSPCDMTIQPGNLRWMAPEVSLRSSGYTLKADVFSYGLVVWELMSRRVPFEDMKPAEAAFSMANANLRPAIPQSCPDHLVKLISKCWQAQASKRPAFRDVARWLENSYASTVQPSPFTAGAGAGAGTGYTGSGLVLASAEPYHHQPAKTSQLASTPAAIISRSDSIERINAEMMAPQDLSSGSMPLMMVGNYPEPDAHVLAGYVIDVNVSRPAQQKPSP